MIYKEVSYSYKAWFTTILVAPAIIVIIWCTWLGFGDATPDYTDYIYFYLALVFIGGIVSFPVFAIFFVIVKVTINYSTAVDQSKCLIAIGGFWLSVATFCIPFYLLVNEFPVEILYPALCYGLCLAWFSWFYDLVERPETTDETLIIINQ